MTEEINDIVRKISETQPKMIAGFNEDTVIILDPKENTKKSSNSAKMIKV